MWVVATRDYQYDETLAVKIGQVFELRGHPNDGLLLKHRHVVALDPQPTAVEVAQFPQCGECGARFQEEWQRDRCGREHEAAVLTAERRERRATHVVAPHSRAAQKMRLSGARG
jgi:hypothetical protein